MCFCNILLMHTFPLSMPPRQNKVKISFSSVTPFIFFLYCFCLFFNTQHDMFVDHVRKCDCLHDSVVVMIVDFVATFQVILNGVKYVCILIHHGHSRSTVIIQCPWGQMCYRFKWQPLSTPFSLHFLSLRWREMGMRRSWAAWVAVVSARWGRDGGTSLWANVG